MCEHVVARLRSVTRALRDERGNELFVFLSTKFFESKGRVFDCALLGRALGPKLAASFFSWVVQFLRLDYHFWFGCFESVFVLCQTNEQLSVWCRAQNGLLCWCFFVFASATDENRVQQVLFSFSFRVLFCVTDDAEGSTACAFETFHTWFEKVINFRWCQIGEETFPIVVPVVLPFTPFPHTSSWFLYRSFFQRVGKSREKGICFEFMLWILNEFLHSLLAWGSYRISIQTSYE